MELVKKKTLNELTALIGELVKFKSSCEFFPNFNVTGRVTDITMENNEFIFHVNAHPNNKKIKIGSNMANLQYEILYI